MSRDFSYVDYLYVYIILFVLYSVNGGKKMKHTVFIKKAGALFLCAAMCLPLSACGSSGSSASGSAPAASEAVETVEPFDLDAYKEMVTDGYYSINQLSLYFSALETTELEYMKALNRLGGSIESEDVAQQAEDALTEYCDLTYDDLDEINQKIRDQYREISLIEIEGKEAEKIGDAYERLYKATEDIYSEIKNPNPDLSVFADDTLTYSQNYLDADDDLVLYLELDSDSSGSK